MRPRPVCQYQQGFDQFISKDGQMVKEGAQSQQILDDRTKDLNAAKAQRDASLAALNSSQKALKAAPERVASARSAIAGQQASF